MKFCLQAEEAFVKLHDGNTMYDSLDLVLVSITKSEIHTEEHQFHKARAAIEKAAEMLPRCYTTDAAKRKEINHRIATMRNDIDRKLPKASTQAATRIGVEEGLLANISGTGIEAEDDRCHAKVVMAFDLCQCGQPEKAIVLLHEVCYPFPVLRIHPMCQSVFLCTWLVDLTNSVSSLNRRWLFAMIATVTIHVRWLESEKCFLSPGGEWDSTRSRCDKRKTQSGTTSEKWDLTARRHWMRR
jgi:hypothetical protein